MPTKAWGSIKATRAKSRRELGDEIEWHLAACLGDPLEAWFHDTPRYESTAVLRAAIRRCRDICDGCPIKRECLEFALAGGEHGFWGGTTRNQRTGILRLRGRRNYI